jgi:type IV pilus assembly protein PilV
MRRSAPAQKSSQQGVVLIETLIAILLFSFGLLALIGLQAVLSKDVTHAKTRSEASLLANQLIGQIWTDQTNLNSYAMAAGDCAATYAPCQAWRGMVRQTLPSGSAGVAVNGNQVDITLDWQLPGESAGRYQISAVVTN